MAAITRGGRDSLVNFLMSYFVLGSVLPEATKRVLKSNHIKLAGELVKLFGEIYEHMAWEYFLA